MGAVEILVLREPFIGPCCKSDLASDAAIDSWVGDVAAAGALIDAHGPFDILVNNAGVNRPKPLEDVTEDDFDAIVGINVKAAFFVAQAVARGLVKAGRGGSIINMSSQMGHVGAAKRYRPIGVGRHRQRASAKRWSAPLGQSVPAPPSA